MIKNKLVSKELQDRFCEELITFFKEERDEDIGIIQATNFLDFFIENLGKEIYNKGVCDAQDMISGKLEEIPFQLEELKFL